MRQLLLWVAALIVAASMAVGFDPAPLSAAPAMETDSLRAEIMGVADTASPEVVFRIATFLEEGSPALAPDSAGALQLIRRAADAGYSPALNYLGFKYIRGEGLPADTALGLSLIRRAAEQGDPRSFNNLGWIYLQGEIAPKDYSEAARWFEAASSLGVPTASAMLADMYREGLGVQPDTTAADSLYTLAIRGGLQDAQLKLISLRADDWATLPADSVLNLGLTFYPAPGPAVGIVLFSRAADLGDARAMALLGDAFSRGIGVRADDRRAVNYYYKAALGGNPSAQFVVAELLDMYPDALSDFDEEPYVIDDPQYWYSRAAAAGITDAAQATTLLFKQ